MLKKLTLSLLPFLLLGCSAVAPYGKELYEEEAERIRTIEIVVLAPKQAFDVQRQFADPNVNAVVFQSAGTGVLGQIAAASLTSSENRQYANQAEAMKKQMQGLADQVNGFDFQETIIAALRTSLLQNGRMRVIKISPGTYEYKSHLLQFRAAYTKDSPADAVLFISTSSRFDSAGGLIQYPEFEWISKTGDSISKGIAYFQPPQPPGTSLPERVQWWNAENRYRTVVLHLSYVISAFVNDQWLSQSRFPTAQEAAIQTEEARKNPTSLAERERLRQCQQMPSTERFDQKNYLIKNKSVYLVCKQS